MAWDFSSDADFHKSLDWIEEFFADELIPLSLCCGLCRRKLST
jgi:hypothetical protein